MNTKSILLFAGLVLAGALPGQAQVTPNNYYPTSLYLWGKLNHMLVTTYPNPQMCEYARTTPSTQPTLHKMIKSAEPLLVAPVTVRCIPMQVVGANRTRIPMGCIHSDVPADRSCP